MYSEPEEHARECCISIWILKYLSGNVHQWKKVRGQLGCGRPQVKKRFCQRQACIQKKGTEHEISE